MKNILAGLLALAAAAAAAQDLPRVNLRVEWRWVDSTSVQTQGADARGGVTVGTGGVRDAQGTVTLRSGAYTQSSDSVQQLVVLNGGRASVRVGDTQPVYWVELFAAPRGVGGVVRQAFVENANGLEVRPRWRGGHAPVEVELSAESARAPDDTYNAQRREAMSTTLQLPAGEWAVVARAGAQRQDSVRGTLSTNEVARTDTRELQLRVVTP